MLEFPSCVHINLIPTNEGFLHSYFDNSIILEPWLYLYLDSYFNDEINKQTRLKENML